MKPDDVVEVDTALITFTTGSTGMPKLLLRKHQFIINQSKAISMTFSTIISSKEEDCTFLTNLNVFGLHFLRVSHVMPYSWNLMIGSFCHSVPNHIPS